MILCQNNSIIVSMSNETRNIKIPRGILWRTGLFSLKTYNIIVLCFYSSFFMDYISVRDVGLNYFTIWVGCPQEGITYFNISSPNTDCLVSRLISENLVEIRPYLPEISPILECGGGAAPKGGNIFQFFSPNSSLLVSKRITENFVEILL